MYKYKYTLHTVYLTHLGFHQQHTWKGKTLLLKLQFQETVAMGQYHLKMFGSSAPCLPALLWSQSRGPITCADTTAPGATA